MEQVRNASLIEKDGEPYLEIIYTASQGTTVITGSSAKTVWQAMMDYIEHQNSSDQK